MSSNHDARIEQLRGALEKIRDDDPHEGFAGGSLVNVHYIAAHERVIAIAKHALETDQAD